MTLQARRFFCLVMFVFTVRMLLVLLLSSHRDHSDGVRQPHRIDFVAGSIPQRTAHVSTIEPLVRFERRFGDKSFCLKQLLPFRDCIDVNKASRDQLMILPEIGERLAMLIIDHRESIGPSSRSAS